MTSRSPSRPKIRGEPSPISPVPFHVHPFVQESCDAYLFLINLVKHQMLFDPIAAAARVQVSSRLAQQRPRTEQPDPFFQLGSIDIHLPFAPCLESVLQNIRDIPGRLFRKNDSALRAGQAD